MTSCKISDVFKEWVAAFVEACEQLQLEKPNESILLKSLFFTDGTNEHGDVVANLSNPIFSRVIQNADQIGLKIVENSKKFSAPFSSYKTNFYGQVKNLAFFIDREASLPLFFLSNLFPPPTDNVDSPVVIICSDQKTNLWTRLRINYVANCLKKLCVIKFKEVLMENYQESKLVQEKSAIEGTLLLNNFSTRVSFLEKNFSGTIKMLSSVPQIVYLVLPINEKKVAEEALGKLRDEFKEWFEKVSLHIVYVANAVCDLTYEGFCAKLRDLIANYCNTSDKQDYSEDIKENLTSFILGYILLSVAPQTICKVNDDRLKDAIFVQYNHARLSSIIRKYETDLDHQVVDGSSDILLLKKQSEWEIIVKCVLQYHLSLEKFLQPQFFSPHRIVHLLASITNHISIYYNSNRIITEINEKTLPLLKVRVRLVRILRTILQSLIITMGANPVDRI